MKPRDEETRLDPGAERELEALEAALAGEPAGPEHAEVAELARALAEMRETPAADFAAELDARAAAGFPGRSRLGSLRGLLPAMRLRPLMPALATGTALIVVATAMVAGSGGLSGGTRDAADDVAQVESTGGDGSAAAGSTGAEPILPPAFAEDAGGSATAEKFGADPVRPAQPDRLSLNGGDRGTGPNAAAERNRFVERDARIVLGTEPEGVRAVADDVYGVVGHYEGIVLRSEIRDGAEGEAGAEFELLIPSAKLSAALADLSQVAEVRSREEVSEDITAPVVTVQERLQDARAGVQGLLKQLANADTGEERESVERQLRFQRQRVASLRSTLSSLERRANLSGVSLDVVTGEAASFGEDEGGVWTISDALDDAGRILAVAAGIALVSLAVLAPIGLALALVLLGRRAWVRQGRERALGES